MPIDEPPKTLKEVGESLNLTRERVRQIENGPAPGRDPADLAAACRARGFDVATASPYLAARGWVQVATMGAVAPPDGDRFLATLAAWLDPAKRCIR